MSLPSEKFRVNAQYIKRSTTSTLLGGFTDVYIIRRIYRGLHYKADLHGLHYKADLQRSTLLGGFTEVYIIRRIYRGLHYKADLQRSTL